MQTMEKRRNTVLHRTADLLFIVFILMWLLLGLMKTLFLPKDVNYLENRPADKVKALSVSSYLDSSFQDSMEKGLADQVPFAQRMKNAYNAANSALQRGMMKSVLENVPNRYVSYMGRWIFNGEYLLYSPDMYGGEDDLRFDANIASYNAVFAANPDIDFYVYYVETDTDINLETGEKAGVFEHIRDSLSLPEGHVGGLQMGSFEDYSRLSLKTDHHWNYVGAYQGYVDILKMLAPNEAPLLPLDEVTVGSGSGSKGLGSGIFGFSEDFTIYRFDFPEMTIHINGEEVSDYGRQSEYIENGAALSENVVYGSVYGSDSGEVIFDTGNTDKENLLVLGDSYDNAILKLLASHFGKTYSVDLRYYEVQMGEAFSLSEYVKERGITKVLLEGCMNSFRLEDFIWEN